MTHDEMIAVIKAHKEGKKIQSQEIGNPNWYDVQFPLWDFYNLDYRIKPEPREFWLCGSYVFWAKSAAESYQNSLRTVSLPIIHVREVVE